MLQTKFTPRFDPGAYSEFSFGERQITPDGQVTLAYSLDDQIGFTERYDLPVPDEGPAADPEVIDALLELLHLVAGVSYFKTAAPSRVAFRDQPPTPAVAELLEALYSEGLGEFAFVNDLAKLPNPKFRPARAARTTAALTEAGNVLVPVGGGKDSAVAIELVRASGHPMALFSVGDANAISRTVDAAGVRRLLASRTLDPGMKDLNASGALNGHVPITAVISAVALLTAALNGFDTVALANERSASSGNVRWAGHEINHQFSKGLRAENLLRAALAEAAPQLNIFSVLRPSSELGIARAFARYPAYHDAFTSCNAIFRLDPERRLGSWCCDCPKCRFVYLILAPFFEPDELSRIFGSSMLDDPDQFDGFALLVAVGGHKPFECVGEEEECLAAIRMLLKDERWSYQAVLQRFAREVMPTVPADRGDPEQVLALSPEHNVPASMSGAVDAILGS